MSNESEQAARRRGEIEQRLDAISTRMEELAHRAGTTPGTGMPSDWHKRVEEAHRHADAAQTAAILALGHSAAAFRIAAAAHDRAAAEHESAVAGDPHEHQRRAELHRAAAISERQRAERAESLASGADPVIVRCLAPRLKTGRDRPEGGQSADRSGPQR